VEHEGRRRISCGIHAAKLILLPCSTFVLNSSSHREPTTTRDKSGELQRIWITKRREKWVVHLLLIRAIRPQKPASSGPNESAALREAHLPLLPSGPDGVREHQSHGD